MDPRGRVALVTGGAVRVGRALALALAERGARLAIHYHASAAEARDVVRDAQAMGADAWAVQADLAHPDAPDALVDAVAAHFGALDVLVNSAAIMWRTPLAEITVEQWDAMFALNLRAPFFCARAAARVMGERGGVIVNIADLAGLESWSAYIPHGTSKAGVIHMTRALAHVLAPKIRVNAIAPGTVLLPADWDADAAAHLVRTTPLRRLGEPADVSRALLYLIEADYVTGEVLVVDGGRSVR
ncbi:MAG: SDR family oxidoreductase [Gemmatimonadaceae bacterium]